MPRNKRSPIEYDHQFGAGIFRPKSTVENELANLEHAPDTPKPSAPRADRTPSRIASAEPDEELLQHQPTPLRANDRTSDRTNVRTNDRTRIRHSFDVWQDQLLALTQIQTNLFMRTGKKPKLGELVQDALDTYIRHQQERTNVRTDARIDDEP